jgi:putative ABC transport system permease protein
MKPTIVLDAHDLAIAAVLVGLDGVISLAFGLGLHRQLAVAAVRMVVQLLLIGVILTRVFAPASPLVTLAVILAMVAIAGREVAVRPDQRLIRLGNYTIGLAAVAFATGITSILALTTALRPEPWYAARYAIPLVGIVLGNVLNAATLALDTLLSSVVREKAAIEAQLSLGATAHQAMSGLLRSAMRRGLLPVVNAMSASGLVTLPGIMTGQIIAGIDPMEAVKYQILLMFLLSGGAGFSAMAIVFLTARRLIDSRQRLRLDRLIAR